MSYEWFNNVGLDITFIFITQIVFDIMMDYFNPINFFFKSLHMWRNKRTIAEHVLFTFMPKEYPIEERLKNIISMILACSFAGGFSPIVFLLLSLYIIIFMISEMNNAYTLKRMEYLNVDVFMKLVRLLQLSYFIFLVTSGLSFVRVLTEINSKMYGFYILGGLFFLLFIIFLIFVCCKNHFFFSSYNSDKRFLQQNDLTNELEQMNDFSDLGGDLNTFMSLYPLQSPKSGWDKRRFPIEDITKNRNLVEINPSVPAKKTFFDYFSENKYIISNSVKPAMIHHYEQFFEKDEMLCFEKFFERFIPYAVKNNDILKNLLEENQTIIIKFLTKTFTRWNGYDSDFINLPLKDAMHKVGNYYLYLVDIKLANKNKAILKKLGNPGEDILCQV
jgi:hypothetical protein